jgi:mono/diheme cytochrome c family protein
MKTVKTLAYLFAGLTAVLCLVFAIATAKTPQESEAQSGKNQGKVRLIASLEGPDLFRSYCASCHGLDGKGNGPVSSALKTQPADLTTISRRNGGIFPVDRVSKIIAGDELVTAHGSREMPVWGPIFHQIELDRDFGDVRLHNLTKYIESIQQK